MRVTIGFLILALILLAPFPVGSQTIGLGGPPSCTVAQVIAQTCGSRIAGYRVVITDGANNNECGNTGDTGSGSNENVCRFSDVTSTWIPDEGIIKSYVSFKNDGLVWKETIYSTTTMPICTNSILTEVSGTDPLDEWVPIDTTMEDVPDCDATLGDVGDDHAFGFCYAPTGYDTYDTTFHATTIQVRISAIMHAYATVYDTYNQVVASRAEIKAIKLGCTCAEGSCEDTEACDLTVPPPTGSGTVLGGRVGVYFDGRLSEWDCGDCVERDSNITYMTETTLNPGDCVAFTVKMLSYDSASCGDQSAPICISAPAPYGPNAFGLIRSAAIQVSEP